MTEYPSIRAPKYVQIADHLRSRLVEGKYRSEDKLPPEQSIADGFRVNRHTVRQALAVLVAEGRLRRVNGVGTFVVPPARAPRGRTGAIGITMRGSGQATLLYDPYYREVLKGVESVLAKHQKSLHFKRRVGRFANTFSDTPVDGMLVFPPRVPQQDELVELHAKGIPAVVLGAAFSPECISFVTSDDTHDSCAGVERLIEKGHTRIAFVTPSLDLPSAADRLLGFRHALANHAIPFDTKTVLELGDDMSGVSDAVLAMLRLRPSALFSTQTTSAARVIESSLGHELDAFRDIELLVYDDFNRGASSFGLPCTVIRQPLEDIGRKGAQALLALIDGTSTGPVRIRLKSELVQAD